MLLTKILFNLYLMKGLALKIKLLIHCFLTVSTVNVVQVIRTLLPQAQCFVAKRHSRCIVSDIIMVTECKHSHTLSTSNSPGIWFGNSHCANEKKNQYGGGTDYR